MQLRNLIEQLGALSETGHGAVPVCAFVPSRGSRLALTSAYAGQRKLVLVGRPRAPRPFTVVELLGALDGFKLHLPVVAVRPPDPDGHEAVRVDGPVADWVRVVCGPNRG